MTMMTAATATHNRPVHFIRILPFTQMRRVPTLPWCKESAVAATRLYPWQVAGSQLADHDGPDVWQPGFLVERGGGRCGRAYHAACSGQTAAQMRLRQG